MSEKKIKKTKTTSTKKPYKKKDKAVISLAASILEDKQEEEKPEVASEVSNMTYAYQDGNNEIEKEVAPTPVRLEHGTTKYSAYVLVKNIREMEYILKSIFGPKDGDYFVGSENTMTSFLSGERKRYKCCKVTDRYNFNYIMWFDVTNLGPVY